MAQRGISNVPGMQRQFPGQGNVPTQGPFSAGWQWRGQAAPPPFIGAMPGQARTDTVPAMLSPHEAVLNVNAANMLGRDNIDRLNRAGNWAGGFQAGTSNVAPPPSIYPTIKSEEEFQKLKDGSIFYDEKHQLFRKRGNDADYIDQTPMPPRGILS
jgi:hypothetical protein